MPSLANKLSVSNPVYQSGITYDTDAQTWFNAVVAAGDSISDNNKLAVSNLFVGMKALSSGSAYFWTNLTHMNLFMGANSLTGALVPVIGASIVNHGFVSGDYSRTTGLIGSTTSGAKYIDTSVARNGTFGTAAFITALPTTANSVYVGTGAANSASANVGLGNGTGATLAQPYFKAQQTATVTSAAGASIPCLYACIKNNSTTLYKFDGYTTTNGAITTAGIAGNNFGVLGSGAGGATSDARMGFYAINSQSPTGVVSGEWANINSLLQTFQASLV